MQSDLRSSPTHPCHLSEEPARDGADTPSMECLSLVQLRVALLSTQYTVHKDSAELVFTLSIAPHHALTWLPKQVACLPFTRIAN